MKNLFFSIVAIVFVECAISAPVNLIGSLTTVSNTTAYSATNTTFNYTPYMQVFVVQHGLLTSTNALLLNFQQSVDQTNFLTTYSWRPSSTNAAYETISASAIPVTNYFRIECVTTNSVQVNTTYGS